MATPFLTSAIGGGEWSTSCLCPFTPKERAAETHSIEGRVDGAEKKKKTLPCRGSNPDSSVVKAVAQSPYRVIPPPSENRCRKMHVLQQTSSSNFRPTLFSCRYFTNSSILAPLVTLHATP
jgi:hypothetical protein